MKTAIIAITDNGYKSAKKLKSALHDATLYFPSKRGPKDDAVMYDVKLSELTTTLFNEYDGLIFCMALGIVIRMIAPHVKSKYTDPAVVVVDDQAHFSISALSGHEGGANNLSITVANIIGANSVVTTASDSAKSIVIGIGCRRGVAKDEVISAILSALSDTGFSVNDVRCVATIDIKQDEVGLIEACMELKVPLEIISSDLIKNFNGEYDRSPFVKEKIGVEGVCEPCALLAGRKPKLVLKKRKTARVTVAITKDSLL
ncbi:cobalt-precorrin 5A hydrolase [Thermodesulfobacteriota bacterium]